MTDPNHNENDGDEVLFPSDYQPADPFPADRWEFVHLVNAVVVAETKSGAIGTAIAAFTHLSVRNKHVDTHQLVDEFKYPPESYLTRRWGHLPGTTRFDSETGQRILKIALQRAREPENASDEEIVNSEVRVPYLCTESGAELGDRSDLMRYQRQTNDPIWIVPAVTFHYLWD